MEDLSLDQFVDKLCEIFPAIIQGFIKQQSILFLKGKLTIAQFFILDFLYRSGKLKMTDIALHMGITTPAVTGIIDRLARDHYVKRLENPSDRRVVEVVLLSKGKKLLEKIYSQRRQILTKIFGKLSTYDREQYLRILSEIKKILIEMDNKNI